MARAAKPEPKPAEEAPLTLRRRIFIAFDPRARPEPGLSKLNAVMSLAVIVCVLMAILDTEPSLSKSAPLFFRGAELFFLVLFSAEYIVRVWVAPEDPRYRGVWGRLKYMLSPWAIIDLLAILPAMFASAGVAGLALRGLRILRLIRLARFGAFSDAAEAMGDAVQRRQYELMLTAGMGFLFMLTSATLLYFVEGPVQPDKFGSIPRALWWAVATLTTVGYGDVYPVTVVGKIMSAFTALAGIAFVAMPTGILAAAFSDAIRARQESKAGKKADE